MVAGDDSIKDRAVQAENIHTKSRESGQGGGECGLKETGASL